MTIVHGLCTIVLQHDNTLTHTPEAMTIKINEVSKQEADQILQHVYEAQKSSVYGPVHTVYGSVVTAQYNTGARTMTLQSNSLSKAAMKDYLPAQYR